MTIRDATPADIPALFDIALKQAEEKYPNQRPSKDRIRHVLRYAITSAASYVRVYETNGVIEACLAVPVQDHVWAERKVGHIMLWVSDRPTAGAALMRDYLTWFRSRRAIRVTGISADCDICGTIQRLLERLGFSIEGTRHVMYN